MTKTKFNVIFDLDHTIITPLSGGVFLKHKEDWKFKPTVLSLILNIYDTGGNINIYTNQAGVSFGHIRPNDLDDLMVDVIHNIVTFICYERGDKFSRVIRRFNTIFVMDYNSPIRKGIPLTDKYKHNLTKQLKIDKHAHNIFIGDGSGIDLTYTFNGNLTPKLLETFKSKTEKVLNCKVSKVEDGKYRILSNLKSDIIAANELGCDTYFDIDLLLNFSKLYNTYDILNSIGHTDKLYNYEQCPNLLVNKDIDFGIEGYEAVTVGLDPTKL